jgi:hypothetical protein
LVLFSLALGLPACSDTSTDTERIPLTVESQDEINSENGQLRLRAGTLSILSVSLIGAESNIALLGPATVDLAIPRQELNLSASVPAGEYSGLQIQLAPAGGEGEMLDVEVISATTGDAVRVTSSLAMSGQVVFPEGPRTVADDSELELVLLLRGMFFYMWPMTDAVDGLYVVGESGQDVLTMDLINMFDLRVLP